MKTFRFIGMALFAVLMCVNLTSCSGGDDDPTEETEEGGVVINEKKITKIVGKEESEKEFLNCTFSYDNKGRLVDAMEDWVRDKLKYTYQFSWGDNDINVLERIDNYWSGETLRTFILTLKNGLVQSNNDETYSYNSLNRFIKDSDKTIFWDSDKLIFRDWEKNDEPDYTLTYGQQSCKGYFPFVSFIILPKCSILYMAHPEIAGMRTTQLPTGLTETFYSKTTTATFTYEFDKDGYVIKMIAKATDGLTKTYTITWQ